MTLDGHFTFNFQFSLLRTPFRRLGYILIVELFIEYFCMTSPAKMRGSGQWNCDPQNIAVSSSLTSPSSVPLSQSFLSSVFFQLMNKCSDVIRVRISGILLFCNKIRQSVYESTCMSSRGVHPPKAMTQPSPSLPLEVGPPQIQLGGLGERCQLPQWGLERSRSQNRIWCILALLVKVSMMYRPQLFV